MFNRIGDNTNEIVVIEVLNMRKKEKKKKRKKDRFNKETGLR